jgi:hypothetical protein
MLFLVNPAPSRGARRRITKAAKKAAKKSSRRQGVAGKSRGSSARGSKARTLARQLSASGKQTRRTGGKMAAKRKRVRRKATTRKASPRPRRRKARVSARKRSPVQRLARGKVYVTNGRKRRRSYRRNARIGGGLMTTLQRAGKDALGIVGGIAATNLIARRIPYGEGNLAIEAAKKIVVALGLGMVVKRVAGAALAEKVVIGGMVSVATDLLGAVPVIGPALAGDDVRSFARSGLSAYEIPGLPAGMNAYPESGYGVADSASLYRQ